MSSCVASVAHCRSGSLESQSGSLSVTGGGGEGGRIQSPTHKPPALVPSTLPQAAICSWGIGEGAAQYHHWHHIFGPKPLQTQKWAKFVQNVPLGLWEVWTPIPDTPSGRWGRREESVLPCVGQSWAKGLVWLDGWVGGCVGFTVLLQEKV